MAQTQNFELPAQRFGEGHLSHDMVYSAEQERIRQLVDSIGSLGVSRTVELSDTDVAVQTVESHGQYI